MKRIEIFEGKYFWLSNFYMVDIMMSDGIVYPSTEHAYQAFKTNDIDKRWEISELQTSGQSKRAGRNLDLRDDWENIKISVMEECLTRKFLHPHLRQNLKDTGNCLLIEGNTWGDTFWGYDFNIGYGANMLGCLLMRLRANIRIDDGM